MYDVMPATLTPTQQLAEVLIGGSLRDYVLDKRHATPKWPWTLIATQLSIDTDGKVNVTHQALRSWYRHADGAA